MDDGKFGTAADYLRAFEAVRAEKPDPKWWSLIRAHFDAPGHTITWARLADEVGYPNGNTVNLQYGKFAERVARQLGLTEKPADSSTAQNPWWLWVLVRWAEPAPSGHTAFVLRPPAAEAFSRLELSQGMEAGRLNRPTYFFLWNPDKDWDSFRNYARVQRNALAGRPYRTNWICRSSRPRPGDCAIMQRTGSQNNGVFARGVVSRKSYLTEEGVRCVELELDSFLPIGHEIPRSEIVKRANYPHNWAPMASGNLVPEPLVRAILALWEDRCPSRAPVAVGQVGAGFGDTEDNKQVESAAVKVIVKKYKAGGWEVRSVERDRCGYDLECSKNGVVEHVEVKGVRGTTPDFIITAAEVKQARTNPKFVLLVVTSALSRSPSIHRYTGAEFCEKFGLSAIQYRATLKP